MRRTQREKKLSIAAAKAGMDEKTARKYRVLGKLPSQCKKERKWRTRADVFEDVWPRIETILKTNPSTLSTTLFDYLCRNYIGRFQECHLRTLQRRIKIWKATQGEPQEVMFPQNHHPGRQCQSDFTDMSTLHVTIANQPFLHLYYHFVLTYSNWETGTICFSESYEALSVGLQNALWELGAVPEEHRTDSLSAAINNQCDREKLTERYSGLVSHYGLRVSHTQAGNAHENGDIEQAHHRFKLAVGQELILRGSTDFRSREEYDEFLRQILERRNAMRKKKLVEELTVMRTLPERRLEDFTVERVRVSRNSTINIRHNAYSVDSRLIGETIDVRIYAERLEIWYSSQKLDEVPRMRGESNHCINYRHIIGSLVKKPGAFANYRYRSDLFPRFVFRTAYDELRVKFPATADRQYLAILHLAALRGEEKVNEILHHLLQSGEGVSDHVVKELLDSQEPLQSWQVSVDPVSVDQYDKLLQEPEVSTWAAQ
jgi:hypothetical protein